MPSLLDAIEKKYTVGDDEPQDCSFILLAPKTGARAAVPQILVLNNCQVDSIGDETKLLEMCSDIKEIDLSHNQLNDWNEVAKMLRIFPTVTFLNLSFNNLSVPLDSKIIDGMDLHHLNSLVLVSTQVEWSSLWKLLNKADNLHELHLSLNNFDKVEIEGETTYPSVTKIMFNKNNVGDWNEIAKLGVVFPNLKYLSLAGCPIKDIKPDCWKPFTSLESLTLCDTHIANCDDIGLLTEFPKLKELRLSGISFLAGIPEKDRRKLLVALLPKIIKLNGGASILDEEREGAERSYIRRYLDPTVPKTSRYHELVAKHGEVDPLVEISLKPKRRVKLRIIFGESTSEHLVNLYQTVQDFKKSLEPLIGLQPSRMLLYYNDVEMFGMEPLKFPNKFLYSYKMNDGDEIYVEMKNNTNREMKQ